jgi:hypothetical protein
MANFAIEILAFELVDHFLTLLLLRDLAFEFLDASSSAKRAPSLEWVDLAAGFGFGAVEGGAAVAGLTGSAIMGCLPVYKELAS